MSYDVVEEDTSFEEIMGNTSEKKRRLSVDQVKALEKNFAAENKLEPEKKARLAAELGVKPRQVAIWFQNRRARLKTKQLEKDYGVLKASYDALMIDYSNLEQERQELTSKVEELRTRLGEDAIKEDDEERTAAEMKIDDKFQLSSSVDYLKASYSSLSDEPVWSSNYQTRETRRQEEQCCNLASEEPCNFFSIDYAPTLQW